jgi:thiazole synthase
LFWVPENLVRINKWKKPFSIWDELVTVAQRIDLETETDAILAHLKHPKLIYCPILRVQEMRKSHFCCAISPRNIETNGKTQIHPDPKYLLPDAIETLKATGH